jgi:4-oxalocrotonate tautomerase
MPSVIIQGPIFDDIDKKRTLVAEITASLKKAYGIPTSHYPIVIHENPPENVGVNGKLIFDKK